MNIREQRIRELQVKLGGHSFLTVDGYLQVAKLLFPYTRSDTLKSYCIAVMELEKSAKKR